MAERPRPAPDPAAEPLSRRLRARTEKAHRRAERAGVVRDLLAGRASRADYALLLRNLQPVYGAMERRLAASAPLAGLACPEVCRAEPLARDLAALAGPGWARELPLLDAGAAYLARVEAVDAPGLAAHAYVRYLGDLNGGRFLRRMLMEHLGLTADALAFYSFPAIPDTRDFIARYRETLDRLGKRLDPAAVADEAEVAFEHNIALARAVRAMGLRGATAAAQ